MKSKMLGALALLTLIGALFVMQSADQYTPTADAATGSIDALNVGTCLTTDATIFKGDCKDGNNFRLSGCTGSGEWEIREKITEVPTLYATYAHDPKTSSDAPRAILADSDLLKISIKDADRDVRKGVLIRGESFDDDTEILGDADTAGTLAKLIQDDLGKLDYPKDTSGDIKFGSEDALTGGDAGEFDDGILITVRAGTAQSSITSSGSATLNFTRTASSGPGDSDGTGTAGNEPWMFDPGDFDVDDDAVVRFYGCLDRTGGGAGTCEADGNDGTAGNADDEPFIKFSTSTIAVDEDASNGSNYGNTAPWLAVNASVPAGANLLIAAIYYRTSDQENLIGEQTYRECSDGKAPTGSDTTWACTSPATLSTNDDAHDVKYTDNEKKKNTPLMVQATADGNLTDRHVNLALRETKRFSGVYQGYVRLTDANGDGSTTRSSGTGPDNWGRIVVDGVADDPSTTADETAEAVLAVQSGPVIIEYRDSGGTKQTLRIEIDKVAPTINVTSPANGSSSDDQSPDFTGTIEDVDSGLVDKSFRLVVDNNVDDDGNNANTDWVLDLKAPSGSEVTGSDNGITSLDEYSGYGTTDPTLFGVVDKASVLYDLGDDSCDNQDLCHIFAEEYDDGDNRGTFDDDIRLDLWDGTDDVETRDKEYKVDFQAFVMDMAGNIGFSDSDASNPRYINELGKKKADRKNIPNVLGYYSGHVVTLDEKDPDIIEAKSATGYYGLDSDDNAIPDRSSVMIEFDGPIAESSVSNNTFTVELDDKSMASVVKVDVEKNYVFLKLASELASNATPTIDIASGQKVEDMAGNETFGKEQDAFEAKDGISPKLTVTLSGGSGSGTGDEGPGKLTKDQITVNVSSDEMLQGAPRISVVCSTLTWYEGDAEPPIEGSSGLTQKDIDDFVDNRSGASATDPHDTGDKPRMTQPKTSKTVATANNKYEYTCGYDVNKDKFDDEFVIVTPATALARPGENWEYTWKRPTTPGNTFLSDGSLTVVAHARDRSRYEHGAKTNVQNWGSASAEFTLDTVLKSPKDSGGGDLQPDPDGVSKEDRPFVLIEFAENTQVKLDSVELDTVEVASKFEQPQTNRFVYWPESLSKGEHEVNVEATDAAGNEQTFEFSFTVESRGKFLIELQAGWNAVSVPADPVDTAIGSVFSDPAIETVIGWDTQGWRIAVRRDGAWESNHQYGALNEIRAKYGYWVKSSAFIDQPVALKGPISRNLSGSAPTLIGIDTNPGWNFVGVIDQEGDQTEGDDFGTSLMDSQDRSLTASEYLGANYVRAYTWDPTFSRFETLLPKNDVKIGKGIWVYYPETGGIAP